jgi:hypothetical protein
MVINADRLVLTNNHVIDDSTKITGTVASTGKAYPVVGYDKTEDVALSSCRTHRADDGTDRQLLLGQGRIRRRGPGQHPGPGHHHRHGGQVTALNQTITVSNEGGSTASETAGRNDSAKRRRRARRLRQPASGMSTCSVCAPNLTGRTWTYRSA